MCVKRVNFISDIDKTDHAAIKKYEVKRALYSIKEFKGILNAL